MTLRTKYKMEKRLRVYAYFIIILLQYLYA
jgi:hypothetical protein